MRDFILGSIFDYANDIIVVPFSTHVTISEGFRRGLSMLNIDHVLNNNVYHLGDVVLQEVTSHSFFKYILYVCTVDIDRSSYNAIRTIGHEMGRLLTELGFVGSIATPILGTGAGRLDHKPSHDILLNAFYEKASGSISLNFYTQEERIYQDFKYYTNLNVELPSGRLVLIALLPELLNKSEIVKILHSDEFYYELAKDKFIEYLSVNPLDNLFYHQLYIKLKDSKLPFSEFLVTCKDQKKEFEFLTLCGEVVAYIDYQAYMKNVWNKYDDKRVLAKSLVRETNWILNLIEFKITNDVSAIKAKSIKNAIQYLFDPETNLTMLSERHRDLVIKTFSDYPDHPTELNNFIFELFRSHGVRAFNQMNDGVLYSRILYAPEVKSIWHNFSLQTSNFTIIDDLSVVSEISIASKLIFSNMLTKSKTLDLGNCGLRDLSLVPELFECVHLEKLILSNEWGEYDEGKWRKKTTDNKGERNRLDRLPSKIGKLVNLKNLICGGDWNEGGGKINSWSIKNINILSKLSKLEKINLSNNNIVNVTALSWLKYLKIAHLNNNHIRNISSISDLKDLQELYLSNNRIANIEVLNLLPYITTVDLHHNRISNLQPIESLIYKIGIENNKWSLNTISIAKNPLSTPPLEVVSISTAAVLRYFEDIRSGDVFTNREVKMILVGNSEVGKSTFAKYIDNEVDLDKEHPSTHWMVEKEIESKYIVDGAKCILRLFDFGGHDYFHDTHHLFFDSNTIYILLWDIKSNKLQKRSLQQVNDDKIIFLAETQDYPIEYWLESIMHFIKDAGSDNIEVAYQNKESYNSPALVIQNKVPTLEDIFPLNNQFLAKKFPFITEFLNISLKPRKRNLNHFDEVLTEVLKSTGIVGAVLPKFYSKIKQGIKDYQGKPVLSFNEFFNFCNDHLHSKIDKDQCRFLARYLKNIGVILWYSKGPMEDKVYVRKDWVTKNIYKVLKGLNEEKGEFEFNRISQLFESGNQMQQAQDILDIMIDFNMIFRHPSENKYIAPLYLPEMPESSIDLFVNSKNIPYRRFEYSGFIHKNVILCVFKEYSQLILNRNDVLKSSSYYYWKDGLIVKDPNTLELVMIKFNLGTQKNNACIDIFDLTQKTTPIFITRVIEVIKKINQGYEIEEMITLDGVDYISLDILNSNAKSGKLVFTEQRKSDLTKLKINDRLFNLKNYKMFLTEEIRKKKVVISYSKKDLMRVHTFIRYLRPLVDNNLIEEPWYCTNLRTGDEWNETIQKRFIEADIVFFMISEYFYSTKYIIEHEVRNVITRYRNDQSVKIVPIILEHYDWGRKGEWNLQDFSALPYQAKPISDFNNEKIAWNTITASVKMMIEKDLDPGQTDMIARDLQEIYERQVEGKLDRNS